ncbi:unnamed protein product [Kluyveromyces dobzhanskii CBS 2104]|uniref:WGS project CCBQ000000000 data, contig 00058 n=1 Tax=Kluyveromyces dobzhanskii CBS 2104 TaxID=1427455 RepID=A0A0A8LBU0_9SACH|nr:unnamed protein product [Kluyveromyces dobzhanskii CBS 2104]
MSPPSRANSNNPFLSDLTQQEMNKGSISGRTQSQSGHKSPPALQQQQSGNSQSTSAEEKEALRRRYLQIDNEDIPAPHRSSHRSGNGRGEMPPSYDEVAGSKGRSNGYPKEKSSSKSRSRHDGERERREHRSESAATTSSSRRHRKSSSEKKSSSSTEKKSKGKGPLPKNVDVIDKLDVTGLFGGAFHHDGPFDACTPHRNKNSKAAPVMAFPVDGPNSSIAGPTGNKSFIKEVFGHDNVDDDDYLYKSNGKPAVNSSTSTVDAIKPNSSVTQFDTKAKTQLVHGPTTAGLGSTTFLDGAPAAAAVVRDEASSKEYGGIQRKKSLSQRLKVGTNRNDDTKLRKVSSDSTPNSPSMLDHGDVFNNPRGNNFQANDDDDDDYYLGGNSSGVRFDSNQKKESTGNKLLRRVKSLKVSRR